jgi:hypothetical protein
MKLHNKLFGLAAIGLMSTAAVVNPAQAERDVNKAADSVVITKTTYSYDANNDGFIDPTEFNTYITRSVDTDGDGFLESTEYEESSMTYFYDAMKVAADDNLTVQKYTYWDKDKDNKLDSSEIETLVANRGLYKKWDTNLDGKIDMQEFAMGTFQAYDDDGNGEISMSEWSDVVM